MKNKWKKQKQMISVRIQNACLPLCCVLFTTPEKYGKNRKHNKQVIRHDIDDQVDDDGDDVRNFLVVVVLGSHIFFYCLCHTYIIYMQKAMESKRQYVLMGKGDVQIITLKERLLIIYHCDLTVTLW